MQQLEQQYTPEQLLVLVALYMRYRSLDITVLRQNRSFLPVRELAQLVQVKQKRLYDLMQQYISLGGSFKVSRLDAYLSRVPLTLLDHVLDPATLQHQGGQTLPERCRDVELRTDL